MDTSKDPKDAAAQAASSMTAAEAAKAVRRPVVELVDGKEKDKDGNFVKVERTRWAKVEAEEVLSFKDYGTHVVVVTTDGQKLSSADRVGAAA